MESLREALSAASNVAAEPGQRGGAWAVAERYELRYPGSGGERFIRAPTVRSPQEVHDAGDERLKGELWTYPPLVDSPDLFLRFARLGETLDPDGDTDPNAEAFLEWAETYGVLGLTRAGGLYTVRGGSADTVRAFAHEARTAGALLRLYEATTAEPVDLQTIAEYPLPRDMDRTPGAERERALGAIARHVQGRIFRFCSPAHYRHGNGFEGGYDFKNLLGAVWLQMHFLLISRHTSRCRNPECNRVVDFERPPEETPQESLERTSEGRRKPHRTRSDKRFCSRPCRNRADYLRRRA